MKILYHHRTASKDGMDVHITELIAAFKALGHEIILVGPDRSQNTEFGAGGGIVQTIRNFLPRFVSEILEVAYDRVAFNRLEEAYLQHQPDLLYERSNLFLSAGKRLKKKYGVPFFLEVNAPLAEERAAHGGLTLKSFAQAQEASVWCAADAVFPVTHVLAKKLEQAGVLSDHIYVTPNGVNPDVFNDQVDGHGVRKEYGLGSAVTLGFTGFVRPWHGLDKVLSVLATSEVLRDVHFLIVGDGPVRKDLEAMAKALKIQSRVHFTGLVARDQIAGYIAAFDIALQPDVTEYASPLKMFEYLALGKTIIAPNTPNICEILRDQVNACLFRQGDEQDFLRVLEQLVANAEQRSIIGHQAAETIFEKKYLWKENARRIAELASNRVETPQ